MSFCCAHNKELRTVVSHRFTKGIDNGTRMRSIFMVPVLTPPLRFSWCCEIYACLNRHTFNPEHYADFACALAVTIRSSEENRIQSLADAWFNSKAGGSFDDLVSASSLRAKGVNSRALRIYIHQRNCCLSLTGHVDVNPWPVRFRGFYQTTQMHCLGKCT